MSYKVLHTIPIDGVSLCLIWENRRRRSRSCNSRNYDNRCIMSFMPFIFSQEGHQVCGDFNYGEIWQPAKPNLGLSGHKVNFGRPLNLVIIEVSSHPLLKYPLSMAFLFILVIILAHISKFTHHSSSAWHIPSD